MPLSRPVVLLTATVGATGFIAACAASAPPPSDIPRIAKKKSAVSPPQEPQRPRAEGLGFSFAIPSGFVASESAFRYVAEHTEGAYLEVREVPFSVPQQTEEKCQTIATGIAAKSKGKADRVRLATADGRAACRFALTSLGASFALVPLAPGGLSIAVKGVPDADAVIEGVLASWRFESVKSLAHSMFEVRVPENYLPMRPIGPPRPGPVMVRSERVDGGFLGSVVFVPSPENISPFNETGCAASADQMGNAIKAEVLGSTMETIGPHETCRADYKAKDRPHRGARMYVVPATVGAVVVTCNHDDRDPKALPGCKEAVKSLAFKPVAPPTTPLPARPAGGSRL